jgi:hypothetical protein
MSGVPILDLTGGKLDLLVHKGLASTFRVLGIYSGAAVTFAACTWTATIFLPSVPNTPVATLTVSSLGGGMLDLKITATESAKLTAGTVYGWLLKQTPTNTAYGPYPVMSGDVNVVAGG